MMQTSLLSDEDRVRSDYTSADAHEKNLSSQLGGSAASSPAASSIFSQRKSISAAALYGLIAFAGLMTLLCIVFLASWISARAEHASPPPPPFDSSSSSAMSAPSSAFWWSSVSSDSSASGSSFMPPQPSSSMGPTGSQASSSASSSPSAAPALPSSSSSSPSSAAENATDLPNTLTPIVTKYPLTRWPGQVFSYTLLHLLSGLYEVAMNNGGNRAVGQPGFNASVDWLMQQIASKTFLVNVEKTYFNLQYGSTYSNLALTAYNSEDRSSTAFSFGYDWRYYLSTAPVSNASGATLVLIDNQGGCNESDWQDLYPAPDFFFALVQRTTDCADSVRIGFAQLYGAAGILIQVSNVTKNPVFAYAPPTTKIAAISLSYAAGQALVDAVLFGGTSAVSIYANIRVIPGVVQVVTNICGDTPTGDPTSVVLVGGHSDGVGSGPGTNDDGSGSVATLTLAVALTRLMQTTPYKLTNMVKFCWFGAEELGLLGSRELVRMALERDNDPNARVGTRARDWAIMVDLDMLGSLNFKNWIYDANIYIPPNTPIVARNGSKILSDLFVQFFKENNLPWDSKLFEARSDYGPFLAGGIPAGGIFAGADETKTEADRVRYQQMTGWGGVTGAICDQCYHRACDTIGNIQWGVLTNQTQSAAYVLEILAQKADLREYLGMPHRTGPLTGVPYESLPYEFRSGSEVKDTASTLFA